MLVSRPAFCRVLAGHRQTRDAVCGRVEPGGAFCGGQCPHAEDPPQGADVSAGLVGRPAGRTWQERWLASGADAAGAGWRKSPARWLQQHGLVARDWRLDALASALLVAISADLVRPARWGGWWPRQPALAAWYATWPTPVILTGSPAGRALCDADPHVSSVANSHTLHRAAEILATKVECWQTSPSGMSWSCWTPNSTRWHRCPGTPRCSIGFCAPRVSSARTPRARCGRSGQRWAAHTRGTHRPIPAVLPSRPRPAGGLSA